MAVQIPESQGTSIELRFQVADRELFFVRASAAAGCRVELAEMIQRSDGRLLEYFTVEGAASDHVIAAATGAAGIDDARVIRDDDGGTLYEFVVSGPCIGGTLADAGAVVREVVADDGRGHVVADVPAHADVGQVIDLVRERHDAELLARRERDRPMPEFTAREFRATLADRLTERQLETLRTAYASGYFSWPRESTAEDCAEALGISQPTFTQHIRAAHAKLVGALFDVAGTDDPVETAWAGGPTESD